MSFTRNYLKLLTTGLEAIKDFALYPWDWAMKSECDESQDTDNFTNDMVASGVCLACNCLMCCCKAPVACVGSVVTIPVGGTTALIFGVVGVVGLPIPLVMDGANLAIDGMSSCCKQDNSVIADPTLGSVTSASTNDVMVDIPDQQDLKTIGYQR